MDARIAWPMRWGALPLLFVFNTRHPSTAMDGGCSTQ